MKDKEILKDLSEEILVDMDDWQKAHQDATFLEIEEKSRELVSKLEAALVEKVVLEREEDSWKDLKEGSRPTCPNCKVPLISRGKRKRCLQGAQGQEIKLKRMYGTCPKCGQVFFPLDEKLELQPGSLTPKQLSHLAQFASVVSFGQAVKLLKQHHGVEVSTSTSRRQTQAIGASAEAVQNEQAKEIEKQEAALRGEVSSTLENQKQVISSDGAYISLRDKVYAEVKTVTLGEVKEHSKRSRQRPAQEVKMTNITYFSRMTESQTFTELAAGEIARRGFFQVKQVAAVSDGAEWIQTFFGAHRLDAVRILDFYHASQYLNDIATIVRNAGTALPESWLYDQLHELKHQGPNKVLEEIDRLLREHQHLEELKQKVNYLQKRREMMQYPIFQKDGWPIGSGSVESANTHVVQSRMCGAGMHWEPRSVNPMLALRTSECNDRWHEM